MPWWAWLLVDIAVVIGAVVVVARAWWRGWKLLRAFLGRMRVVLADVPRLQR